MPTVPIGVEGTATVVLNASGNGTAQVGPIGMRERWYPDTASVAASSNVKEAQCRLYVGPSPIAGFFIDGTLTGSTGDSTDRLSGLGVAVGSKVWAVWTGGDVGAVATLNVDGSKTI